MISPAHKQRNQRADARRIYERSGAAIKIVFGVADVQKFKAERERDGLKFGPIHDAAGFQFANAKDPAGNPVQISSRGIQ